MNKNRLYKIMSAGLCILLLMGSIVDISSLCRCEGCTEHRIPSPDNSFHGEEAVKQGSCCVTGKQQEEKNGCCKDTDDHKKDVCFCTILKSQPLREAAIIKSPSLHWIKILSHINNAVIAQQYHIFEEASLNAFVRFRIRTVQLIVQPVLHLRL